MPEKKKQILAKTYGANPNVLQTFSFKAYWYILPAIPQHLKRVTKQQSLLWAPKISNCLRHSPNTWLFCYFSSFMKWDDCSAVSSSSVLFQSAISEARQRQVRFSLCLDFADLLYTSGKRLRDNIVVIKIYLGRRSLQAVSLFWMKCP